MSNPLAQLCTDAFLLARFGGPPDTRPDGRAWERTVSSALWSGQRVRRQHAGTLGLFGRGGRSGAQHEIDGACHAGRLGVWLEAKACRNLHKAEVACFAFKAEDLYRQAAADNPAWCARQAWWPVLVSSEPCSESVHRCAASRGVTLCDPQLLGLPALLHVAGRPDADMHVDERLLGQLVDLATPVCRPIQQRLRIDESSRTMRLPLDEPAARHIGDLLFVQHKLTDQILDHYETDEPGWMEARGEQLAGRLRAYALTG